MEPLQESLKERLKGLRQEKGWSQEDLARAVGVSLSTIQRWEARGGKPSRLARRQIEKVLEDPEQERTIYRGGSGGS